MPRTFQRQQRADDGLIPVFDIRHLVSHRMQISRPTDRQEGKERNRPERRSSPFWFGGQNPVRSVASHCLAHCETVSETRGRAGRVSGLRYTERNDPIERRIFRSRSNALCGRSPKPHSAQAERCRCSGVSVRASFTVTLISSSSSAWVR